MRHIRPTRPRLVPRAALLLILAACAQAVSAQTFDQAEFAARRAKLLEQIGEGVAVVFAAEPHVHAVKFRQSPDFYYLTGIEEPGAILLLSGPTKRAAVFARKRTELEVSVEGPGVLDEEQAAAKYGLPVIPLESFFNAFNSAVRNAQKLYAPLSAPDELQMGRDEMRAHEMELTVNPLYRYTPLVRQAVTRLRELHPQLAVADVNPLIDRLRWIKTPYEITRLRESGRIGAEGVKAAMRGTRPGMYEYELEAAARFVQTRLGARGDAFTPIVASGPNTITWHYAANRRRMEAGDVVLIDYGADFDYYTSDITRTWPVSGRFTPEQEKMYRCILDARNAIIGAMKPGVSIKQLQDAAEEVYKRHGFHQQFLEFGRYIGHPVGLSVHDVDPDGSEAVLQPGVVFNVEPLIEFRERKIHMRLEDSVLVTPTGAENLTAAVPADIEAVYALIKQKGIGIDALVRPEIHEPPLVHERHRVVRRLQPPPRRQPKRPRPISLPLRRVDGFDFGCGFGFSCGFGSCCHSPSLTRPLSLSVQQCSPSAAPRQPPAIAWPHDALPLDGAAVINTTLLRRNTGAGRSQRLRTPHGR
jgi:Xaa-Pro aminopeptidase